MPDGRELFRACLCTWLLGGTRFENKHRMVSRLFLSSTKRKNEKQFYRKVYAMDDSIVDGYVNAIKVFSYN